MGKSLWTSGPEGNSRKLLDIVLEHEEKGNSKLAWPVIAKIFNAQTTLGIEWKQSQNHYNDLKGQFKAWEELQRMTGIAYNPDTKEVDVEERSSERWTAFLEKHRRIGLLLAKNGLENLDLLQAIFQGKSAQGVGCFSPAMGKQTAVLSKSVEDLTIADPNEGSGDTADDDNDQDVVHKLSYAESISLIKAVVGIASGSGRKRKSETSLESDDCKRRQASFKNVMEMLSKAAKPKHPPPPTKAELVRDALEGMQFHTLCGPEYFVKAYTFLLSEPRHTDGFLALDETYRWLYLKNMDVYPPDI